MPVGIRREICTGFFYTKIPGGFQAVEFPGAFGKISGITFSGFFPGKFSGFAVEINLALQWLKYFRRKFQDF
jgi:hypothetical protein